MKSRIELHFRSLCLAMVVFMMAGLIVNMVRPETARAQQSGSITLQAEIGFDGNVKPDSWVPMWVHIENSGPGEQGYIQVNFLNTADNTAFRFPVDLPAGAKKELVVNVYSPNYAYEAEVSYYRGQQKKANAKLQISLRSINDQIIAVAAETPSHFNILNLIDPPGGDTFTSEIDLMKLPDSTLGLESLDIILVSNTDSGVLSQAQVNAIAGWVASGGRLFLFGGPNWQETTAGFVNAEILPLLPSGSQLVDDWSDLSSIAQGQPELSGEAIVVTGAVAEEARVLAATTNDLPLIVQLSIGSGEVIFFTSDPTLAPLNGWPGMETLYRYLLSRTISAPPWQQGISDWYSAQNATRTLPNLNLPPIILVCGFLTVYVIILGPVNFLIVRKLKRRELGWLTTTGLIVLFSLVVLISGGLSRSRQPILNRLAILQVWPGAPLARLDGVLGIYSPFRSTYQLDYSGDVLAHGMPTSMSPINNATFVYQNSGSGYIPDLRVEVSDIHSVSVEGYVPTPQFEGDFSISIDASGATLIGRVSNLSDLSLDNAVLVTSGGSVKLGEFLPGETRDVEQALNRNLALQPSKTGIYPAKPVPFQSGPFIYPNNYSGNTYDIEAIVGTHDFYSSREVFRKYSLVSSVINHSMVIPSVGNEIYLTGWINQPILPVQLHEKKSEMQDTSLILVRFDPTIETPGDEIKISPEFFTWTPLDLQSISFSPYQLYFYGAEVYGYAYKPTLAIDFTQVNKLILHLERMGSSGPVTEIEVSLWDVKKSDWEKISGIQWGETEINDPGRYVQPDGTIQLQLQGSGQFIEISRVDFTLYTKTVTK